ncbi:MAG: GlsB/YeaQ/YmgE family stress response membrane protein, partial [Anaerolineae bacterium]|nr:GlsB/YeaQ/YmgE family stress response membrane protein [Anaerolineae bacterium]
MDTEQILVWVIIGALAGSGAGMLVRRRLYFYELVIAGLLGALVGGFIVKALELDLPDASLTFTLGDLITAFIGAAVLIILAEIVV